MSPISESEEIHLLQKKAEKCLAIVQKIYPEDSNNTLMLEDYAAQFMYLPDAVLHRLSHDLGVKV